MNRGAWWAAVHRAAKELDTSERLNTNIRATLIPGSGRSPGEGIGSGTPGYSSIPGLLCGSDGKESTYNAGDLGLIPGSGRSPRERNGKPLQYSCLNNPMNRGAWGIPSMEPQRARHD